LVSVRVAVINRVTDNICSAFVPFWGSANQAARTKLHPGSRETGSLRCEHAPKSPGVARNRSIEAHQLRVAGHRLRIAATRFARFAFGLAVRTPNFGIAAKFFFNPKPVKWLDNPSAEIARASITMVTQSA
jgi:hypothetical protein